MLIILVAASLLGLVNVDGCSQNATALDPFDVSNYLGRWYEIAVTEQFRQEFEKDLVCTMANYSLNSDGTIKVYNVGYEGSPSGDMKGAIGTAKQVKDNSAELEVSFYGPFYSPYWVIHTINDNNNNYQIALIWSCQQAAGIELYENAWILARDHSISDDDYNSMRDYAIEHGINVDKLNMTKTDQTDCLDLKYV